MLEELRVSLFAQALKTPYPVSEKRLQKHWETLMRGGPSSKGKL
jgi:ATP-dependent helicase HrpA